MAKTAPVERVKLLVAILWSSRDALQAALAELSGKWGEIDFLGPDHPFDSTRYYESEMGSGLMRRLISFLQLVQPDRSFTD